MEIINSSGFAEMSTSELQDTNGGWVIAIPIVKIAGGVIAFGAGALVGYYINK